MIDNASNNNVALRADVAAPQQAERELREALLNLEAAERRGNLGSWSFDVRTGAGWWSRHMYRIFGRDPAAGVPGSAEYLELLHPDDRASMLAVLEQMARGEQPEEREFRTNPACAQPRVLSPEYRAETNADDQIVRFAGTVLDITERRQVEQLLQASERRYQLLTDYVNDIVWQLDASLRFVYASSATERVLGYAEHEVRGMAVASLLDAEGIARMHAVIQSRRDSEFGANRPVEYKMRHKAGHWVDVEVVSSLVYGADGRIAGFVGITRDITERKRAERALHSSEEQYRGLMESLDNVIATVDYAGRFLYVNDVAARQLGAVPEAMIGRTMHELFPKPAADYQLGNVQRAIREDCKLVNEAQSIVQNRPRWYRTTIQPIHDEQHRAIYALINSTDIHDLKTAQHELEQLNGSLEQRVRERTAEVQDLYDNAPCGYHSLDASGRIIRINQTELSWLGYARDEVIGRPFTDFVTPVGAARFPEQYAEFIRCGYARDVEYEHVRKDGSTFPALLNATALYDAAGGYVMSRTTVFDNTERKRTEETLRRANAQMQQAIRLKDEFLANMSHELRTPLNAILAFSEGLIEQTRGRLNQRQQAALASIEASGRHLLALINGILDLSKVEAGQLDLHIEPVWIADACQASMLFVRALADKKALTMAFALNDHTAMIEADPRRLKQMLVNLLSNAVKFTPPGGRVSLEVEADAVAGAVRFAVQDTGIGIASADLPRLFQPFSQLDSSLSRQHEGTGLGLVLVRRLAELHGGTVTVESTPGQGSCFRLILPYRPPAGQALP
ncbi:PAS domain S-box protein [Kouleothrix sp.]|uniref:PAS domain S-box protein n=1 Tax=Kouleothrix sp. TaxID=2779161 RepID=UPI00391DBE00